MKPPNYIYSLLYYFFQNHSIVIFKKSYFLEKYRNEVLLLLTNSRFFDENVKNQNLNLLFLNKWKKLENILPNH